MSSKTSKFSIEYYAKGPYILGQSGMVFTKYLVQRATAVQLQATALSVRVSHQSASTVPCGIPLTIPTSAINQTISAAAATVSCVLPNTYSAKNMNHNASLSLLQQQTADYYHIGSRSLIFFSPFFIENECAKIPLCFGTVENRGFVRSPSVASFSIYLVPDMPRNNTGEHIDPW